MARSTFAEGDLIAGWRLIRQLGHGGMSEVWLAERVAPGAAATKQGEAAPAAALKLVTGEPSAELSARFEREAVVLSRLVHDNVVRLLESGRTDDGVLYLATEVLRGETLDQRLQRTRMLPPSEAVRIVRAAGEGLAAAHAVGVIHRDLSPTNIFLCADGGVKVIDFGIAHVTDELAGAQRITQEGTFLGTPSFMAPEQAAATCGHDERTDVWGLAAVLHDALVGRPPFHVDEGALAELVRIVTQPPDPLPQMVPASIRRAVTRALRKDPWERFQSMRAFLSALPEPQELEGIVIPAPRPSGSGLDDDEVRLMSVLVATGPDLDPLVQAIEQQRGVASTLRSGHLIGWFGGREWIGDEAERAVRAALGAPGELAIGVATGRALRRERGGKVTGKVVAAAQEAMGRAKGGARVGICPETQRRISGHFSVEGGYALAELARGGPDRRDIRGAEVPLFGRSRELAALLDQAERCFDERAAASSVLVGPPGIGKTRLAGEVQRRLLERHRKARHLFARGEPTRADSPDACTRELFGGEDALDPAPQGAASGTEARAARDRMQLALANLVASWCSEGPVILSLDDLQWVDAPSLELVDFLMLRLADQPLFVLATARPGLEEDRPDALVDAARMGLRELRSPDVAQIVRAVLGRDDAAIVERAGGNPYFAEELSLASLERAGDELPLTVEAAVQARLDKLRAEEKDALKRAAVLGPRFSADGVEALGTMNAEEVLAALRRRELVVASASHREPGRREWSFRHAVVREVCLTLLTDEQRRELHRAAADWLQDQADAAPEEVAEHLEAAADQQAAVETWVAAHRWARALSDTAGEARCATRALRLLEGRSVQLSHAEVYALHSARANAWMWTGQTDLLRGELSSLMELDEAIGHEADPLDRVRLHFASGLQQLNDGKHEEAARISQLAVEQADASGHVAARIEALALAATTATRRGRIADSLAYARRAPTLAEGGDEALRAAASRAVALAESYAGNVGLALRAWSDCRRALLALGHSREVARVGINLGYALTSVGDAAGARKLLEASLATCRELGMRRYEMWTLHNLGLVKARLGDPDGGLADEQQAIDWARRNGEGALEVDCLLYQAVIAHEASRPAEALALAEQGLAKTQDTGRGGAALMCNAARAAALVALGRFDEALAVSADTLAARAEAGGMAELELDLLLARRDALEGSGRHHEALDVLVQARACFERKAEALDSEALVETFKRGIPTHARLMALLAASAPTTESR